MKTLQRHCKLLFVFLLLVCPSSYAQDIAAGAYHSFFLCSNGTIQGYGDNSQGQLGNGTTTKITPLTPEVLPGWSNIAKIDAYGGYTLVLKKDSTVWSCGFGDRGQIQQTDPYQNYITSLIQFPTLLGIVDIASSYSCSYFLKKDSTVWASGSNTDRLLGDGSSTDRTVPVKLNTLSKIVAIDAEEQHTLYLHEDGSVWAHGRNQYGEVGSTAVIPLYTPKKIAGLSNVKAISAGAFHSLFLKNDGTVWACGANWYGQLGNNSTTKSSVPVQISGLTDVIAIEAGGNRSYFLKNDGTLWACGQNTTGELGDGTTSARITPVQLTSLGEDVATMKAGFYFTLFMKKDESIYTAGDYVRGLMDFNSRIINRGALVAVSNACLPIATKNNTSKIVETSLPIYPNPTKGKITIEGTVAGQLLVVINNIGETVLTEQSQNNKTFVDLSFLPNGIYNIIINVNNRIYTQKIILD